MNWDENTRLTLMQAEKTWMVLSMVKMEHAEAYMGIGQARPLQRSFLPVLWIVEDVCYDVVVLCLRSYDAIMVVSNPFEGWFYMTNLS